MIKVFINASSRYPIDRRRIRNLINNILGEHHLDKNIEVSLMLTGDRRMTYFNSTYLKRSGTTNVISFPLQDTNFPDDVLRLGDIVISYPQARKAAIESNITIDDEIDRLVKHGVLSLLGLED